MRDFKEDITLIDLLEEINKIEKLERIRLRITRAKNNYKRICNKIKKVKQNM